MQGLCLGSLTAVNIPDTGTKDKKNIDDPNSENKSHKKKTFVTRQYGLNRRGKQQRKFKCSVCTKKLDTVREYNQHYLDNHPPTPCPYCPWLFSLPRTMAKHRYSHAESMYECETCGQGFSFHSQYVSHRRIHLTIQGFVCFKAKCGQRFKRELELNAHLKAHESKPIKCDHCDYTNKTGEMFELIWEFTVTNYRSSV